MEYAEERRGLLGQEAAAFDRPLLLLVEPEPGRRANAVDAAEIDVIVSEEDDLTWYSAGLAEARVWRRQNDERRPKGRLSASR